MQLPGKLSISKHSLRVGQGGTGWNINFKLSHVASIPALNLYSQQLPMTYNKSAIQTKYSLGHANVDPTSKPFHYSTPIVQSQTNIKDIKTCLELLAHFNGSYTN